MGQEANSKLRAWSARTIGLAVVYVAVGRLSLVLAIPPGYASAVWAPAGIALAAVLFWGHRVWPGIVLGSFLVNVWTSVDTSNPAMAFRSFGVPLGIGLGAAAQALIGAGLVRRVVGFPTALDRGRDVVRFLALAGPGGCLVSSLIGTATLLAGGVISINTAMISWCIWWVGDTIGVLIVMPLVLILCGEPRAHWRPRALPVGVPLVATFVLVVAVFAFTNVHDQRGVADAFEACVQTVTEDVRRGFAEVDGAISSTADLVASVETLDARTFQRFTEPLLTRHPSVLLMAWRPASGSRPPLQFDSPREVDDPTHEQGTVPYPDTNADSDPPFPIRFLVRRWGNDHALGAELASLTEGVDVLERAQRRGIGSIVIPLPLSSSGPSFATVAMFRAASGPLRTEPPGDWTRGFVEAVVQVEEIVGSAISRAVGEDIDWRIRTIAPSNARVAAPLGDSVELYRPAAPRAQGAFDSSLGLTARRTFEVGGGAWIFEAAARKDYPASQKSWLAWTVLASGLFATGLLGAFLLVVTGRTTRIELLVAERTAELIEANRVLAREASDRRDAETRVRDLLESAPDGMVVVDGTGHIVLVNSQAERMFGYSRGELLGEAIEELIPHRSREAHVQLRAEYSADPRTRPMGAGLPLRGLRKDGSEFPVEISLSPVQTEEGVLISSAIRDITERERADESDRLRRDELAHVARLATMGALATGLAHELNQPLCAIAANADAARNMIASLPESKQELADALKDIAQGAIRAGDIIHHLRSFVRKQTPEITRLDVNKVIREVGDFMKTYAREQRATIRFSLTKGPLPVLGDRIQLQQVILNLVRNGLDAMSNLDSSSRLLSIQTSRTESGEVEVGVLDHGMGLPEEMIEQVFEPFFTTKPHGLGIGLSISRTLVEALGGRLTAKPNPEGGTIFHLRLPGLEEARGNGNRTNGVRRRR